MKTTRRFLRAVSLLIVSAVCWLGAVLGSLASPGQVNHFTWSPINSPQRSGAPFPVIITAQDDSSNVVNSFEDAVVLEFAGPRGGDIAIGNNTTNVLYFPMGSGSYSPERTQVIYLSSDIGGPRRVTALALNVVSFFSPFGMEILANWTIRLKHTSLPGYTSPSWEPQSGWTTVYQANQPVAGTGWVVFQFTTPFDYDGSDNLMVDFSFGMPAYGAQIGCAATTVTNAMRTAWFADYFGQYGDPLTWGNSPPMPTLDTDSAVPDIRLICQSVVPTNIVLSPTNTDTFVNGVWSGNVTLTGTATGVVLRAVDSTSHQGLANPVTVLDTNDLALFISAAPNPAAVSSSLTYMLKVMNSGPDDVTGVWLTNTLPAGVNLVSATNSQGICDVNGQFVICYLGTVTNGTTATVTIVASPSVAGTILTNAAIVTRNEADGNLSNNAVTNTVVVAPPVLIAGNNAVTEGDVGTTNASFLLQLSGPSAQTVTVSYGTSNWTASAGSDYVATSGVVTFAPGVTNQSFSVQVKGDIAVESVEMFYVNLSATNAVLTTNRVRGMILNDDGVAGKVHHFAWSSISSPQRSGTPFPATVTAQDINNNVTTSFMDGVSLKVLSGSGDDVTIGNGTSTANYPLGTGYHDQRTQVIYLTNEIGGACRITALALNVSTVPGLTMSNFTVRLKHTPLSSYSSSAWEGSGWTVVYQTNLAVLAPGWLVLNFTTPFDYNGVGNLMVDFCFNNAAYAANGFCMGSSVSGVRTLMYSTDSYSGDPLGWPDTYNPSPSSYSTIPNVRLTCQRASTNIVLSPPNTTSFVGGVWSGDLTLAGTEAGVVLRAADAVGHDGSANVISVLDTNDLALVVSAAPNPATVFNTLTWTLQVMNAGPTDATGVRLTNTLPAGVNLLGATLSQGGYTADGQVLSCNLGTVSNGMIATVTLTTLPVMASASLTNVATLERNEEDSNPANNAVTNVVIINSAVASLWDTSVLEGDAGITNATFAVTLNAPSPKTVSVNYQTYSGSASSSTDYVTTNGIVTFLPGVTNQSIAVAVKGEIGVELDEWFYVQVSNPTNAIVGRAGGTNWILNDDGLQGQVHHFAWSAVSSPQRSGEPFAVNVSAQDISNNLASTFTSTVVFGISPAGSTNVTFSPANSANFVAGAWSGNVTLTGDATNVILTATDAVGHSGTANSLTVWAADDLAVFMSAAPNPVGYLSNVTYSLQVLNPGPASATGVRITNALPAGMDLVSADSSQGTHLINGSLIVFDVGTLAGGTNATAEIVANATTASTVLTNVATVTRIEADANSANNVVTTAVTVGPRPPILWVNIAGGQWSDAANWFPQLVPGPDDNVLITNRGNYVVNLDAESTVMSLVIGATSSNQVLNLGGHSLTLADRGTNRTGSTFLGPGTLAIAKSLSWQGGSNCSATITVASNAVLTLDTSAVKYLADATLINAGTVNWINGDVTGVFLTDNKLIGITNLAGAIFNIQSYGQLNYSAGGHTNLQFWFDNAGTIVKTNTSASAFICLLHNTGTVAVQQGALQFWAGFTSSGIWDLAVTNAVDLYGGTFNFEPSSQFPNTGNFFFNRQGSSIVINGAVRNLRWADGSFRNSTLTIPADGTLFMDDRSKYLMNSTLINAGTVICQGNNLVAWFNASNDRACITNLPGALFEIQAALGFSRYTNNPGGFTNLVSVFHNAGTLRKRIIASTAPMDWNFINAGTVEVQSGALQFKRGFTSSGTWDLAVTNAIILDNLGSTTLGYIPVYTFEPSSQFLGTGNFLFDHMSGEYGIRINGTIPRLTWGNGYLDGSTLIIPTNGVLNMTADSQKYLSGSTMIINAGTVNCLLGSSLEICGWANQTTGITNLPGGLFDIQADFIVRSNTAYSGASRTHIFHNAGTIRKRTSTGTAVFAVPFVNTGTVQVQSGALRFEKGFTSSGTWDLAVTNAVKLDSVGGYAGPLYAFEPGGQFFGAGNFVFDHGGSDYVIMIRGIIKNLAWRNGTLSQSMLTIAPDGVLTLDTTGTKDLVLSSIVNAGIVNWSSGLLRGYPWGNNQSAAITNLAGGVFNMQGNYDLDFDPRTLTNCTFLFDNAGTISKTTDTGTRNFEAFLHNTGTVSVQQGSLRFQNGFRSSGTWNLAVTNAAYLDAGAFTFEPGGQFPNTGNFVLDKASGTLTVYGTLRNLTWRQGNLNASALGIATNGWLALETSGTKTLTDSTLVNAGTVTWNDGLLRGNYYRDNSTTSITNLPGAVFDMRGSATCDLALNPNGHANVALVFDNAGTLIKRANASTIDFHPAFYNRGRVEVQAGTVNFTNTYWQTDGLTLLNGGNLQSSQPIQILGGVLAGTNTITGSVTNGAAVSPGNPIGTLRITGTYTELPGSALNIDLAGTTGGTAFDVLTNGIARLAGTLNAKLTNGYNPAISNQFQFMRATGVTGVFSQTNAPGFAVNYTNTPVGVKLTFLGLPPTMTTLPATAVTSTSAVLNASVTPFTYAAPTWFEWGTSTDYGMNTPTNVLTAGGSPIPVSAALSNLVAQATYHYRAVASNSLSGGFVYGDDIVFVARDPVLPFATTQPATPAGISSMMLYGMATPNGLPTIAWFEWGSSSSFGSQTAPVDVGSGENVVAVTNTVAGLVSGHSYHCRVAVSNSAGVVYGAEAVLTPGMKVWSWGYRDAQRRMPSGMGNVVSVSDGETHSLALKSDGTVVAWGDNGEGQTNTPAGLNNIRAVAAGGQHSLALRNDGMVVAWGYNEFGQANVPAGLSNVVAITAGNNHCVALKQDGSVVAWGNHAFGQTNVPAGLNNVVAVGAGYFHSLALKHDGTVVAWGDFAPATNTPAGLSNVVAISAGSQHNLAIKPDGTVVAWGSGQTNVPPGLNGVVAVAAGNSTSHNLALKNDGTVLAWGDNTHDQTNMPLGLNHVAAIASGGQHSLALGDNGAPVASSQIVSALHDQDMVITFDCADPNGDLLFCKITALPLEGKLYQCDGGSRGAQISTNGTWISDPDDQVIFVLGTNSFGANCDSFQFAANDGMADSAPATVTINALSEPPWTCGWNSPVCSAGRISLCLTSTVTGYNYVVLCSSNLVDWIPYQTNVTPFTVVVTNTRPIQFFRALYQP